MEKKLSEQIIQAALEVHRHLGGPGLLETVYDSALSYELTTHGIQNQRQLPIPVRYKNMTVREPLYLDILVENRVIIEVKATPTDLPYYLTQLFTHLRLSGIKYGMLINFGKKDVGISHLVNDNAS